MDETLKIYSSILQMIIPGLIRYILSIDNIYTEIVA